MAIGTTEIGIIVLVVLLLFGATAIPKLARGFGQAQGEFLKARKEFEKEVKTGQKEAEAPKTASVDEKRQQLETTAKGLGIDPVGKSDEELRQLIQTKLN